MADRETPSLNIRVILSIYVIGQLRSATLTEVTYCSYNVGGVRGGGRMNRVVQHHLFRGLHCFKVAEKVYQWLY